MSYRCEDVHRKRENSDSGMTLNPVGHFSRNRAKGH